MASKAQSNPCRSLAWGLLLLCLAARALPGETRLYSFTTSKGLAVKVLQDSEMPFIHAQLRIAIGGDIRDYTSLAIAQLTVMNMFERSLNSPASNLLAMLERQGNDFQVEQNPEHITIRMNFLPDRLMTFSRLLKEVFAYQSFQLKKFNESREKFWPLFFKSRDWKKELALLLAYQQLTGNFFFHQGFLLREVMGGLNLAQLRSFQLQTFRPDNALLILKGNINPYVVLGMIEKDLPPAGEPAAAKTRGKAVLNPGRKVFVLNVNSADAPVVYWFDVAPPSSDPAYLSYAVGNFVLFGFPGGRVYQSERNQLLMGGYRVSRESFFFENFTLLCSSLRLNYADLENFLVLVDQERRKFNARPVERKEYLDALNYFIGQAQVETNRFDYIAQDRLDRISGQKKIAALPRVGPDLFQDVSLGGVAQALEEQMGGRQRSNGREKGIIVLVGNADLIVSNLKSFKTEALELPMD